MYKKNSLLFMSASLLPLSAVSILVSCKKEEEETPLEKKYNDYAEKYQSNFINSLSEVYHDFYKSSDLFCSSEAEGVIMGTYGPGFDEGGTQFHLGKTDQEVAAMPDIKTRIGIPNCLAPRDVDKHIERFGLDFHMGDFHYLDEALSRSTAGEEITVYHGYEYNEYEMINDLNTFLGTSDFLNLPAEEAISLDLTKLIGKSTKDLCWCATTFEESFAQMGANGSDAINVPIYKMNIKPDVNCAYVSYSRKKHFDGIYLAGPHECQILTQRKLNFNITNAGGEKRPDNKGNFLYIECDVTK